MQSALIKKLKTQTVISVVVLTLGILVMTYGIIVEDEPTAVALLLITSGIIWLLITRIRVRSLNKLNKQNP